MYKRLHEQHGFTLIEIAVVLVIVGLLIGSFIGTFANRIEITRRDNTSAQLEEIKRVLVSYAFSQPVVHLPCPDINVPPDGLEDRTAGVCDAAGAVGTLPWRDLGLGQADAWNTHFRYWVSDAYANDAGFDISSADVGGGNAVVDSRRGNTIVNIVSNGTAVIFSHGPNRLGGTSTDGVAQSTVPAMGNGHDDENENIDADFIFISRPPTEEGAATVGGVFDDIVTWIGSYELKARMVEAGKLP